MSFVAVAIAGSAVVGAGASLAASSSAAKAQKNAASQATAVQQAQLDEAKREYDQNRTDLQPWRDAGTTALGQLGKGTVDGGEFNRDFTMADFTADPGYQFRLDQGNRGVQASAAAKGGVLSGGTLKALARYNQGEAAQEYGAAYDRYRASTTDRFNRLASIAGIGQQATNAGISASNNYVANAQQGANNISNNLLAAGNARASSYVNAGNTVANLAGQAGQYFALKNLYGSGSGAFSNGAYGISGSDGVY